jgi:ADP-ribosylglycohydrolase
MGGLMVGAVDGLPKNELLAESYAPIVNYWYQRPLHREIDEVAAGSYKRLAPPLIRGTGYVVKTLEAALWAFHNSRSFREGCLLAVNLGDDADTTGAVYGQLAGAFYGEQGIPESWLSRISHRHLIESYGEQLFRLSQASGAIER